MKKLLSCLLSFAIISMSITPSVAQVRPPKLPKKLPTVRTGKLNPGAVNPGKLSAVALRNMRSPLTLQHTSLLSPTATFVPAPRQMVTHPDATTRALLLRSDFTVYGLNQQVQPQEMAQAVGFYRDQLNNTGTTFANFSEFTAQGPAALSVAGTVADISSLGLFGTAQADAPLILNVYKQSVGTAAEPLVTAASAHALLRLGAYDELQQMAHISTQQPELWEGIAAYAKDNNLPLTIENKPRTSVDVEAFQSALKGLSDLHGYAVSQTVESTYAYMNTGRTTEQAAAKQPVEQPVQVQPAAATVAKADAATTPLPEQAVTATASGTLYSSFIPVPSFIARRMSGASTPAKAKAAAKPEPVAEQNLHAFRDQGLAAEGLEATFPVYWEDSSSGKTLDVTFQFENQAAKEAFYNRVDLAADEFFVFDRGTGGIIIRKQLTAEERASGAKPKDRGFFKVFFEGGQKTPLALYKVLFAREMGPAFSSAKELGEVMNLLATYRADLRQIVSADLLAKYPALANYLTAKAAVLDKAAISLLETNKLLEISKDISTELEGILANNAGTPIKVFKDDVGHWAQNFAGFAEGTFGTMGQANTSALGLLGISKGFLSNLPTAAGQFGPAWAPFIGAWAEKYGTKKMLSIGQLLGTGGHLGAATSLALGAMGVLPPLEAFGGMVGGITLNGVAGSILKQINPMVAKQRTSDPVSSSATITDLNAWASIGGMYCYLFLPAVGGATWLLTGEMRESLAALAAMFGVAASIPLTANLLLRKSRIENVVKATASKAGVFKTIGNNLKFGFKSPFLRNMFFATAGGHFMGLGFNSGPGNFIKENISNAPLAMGVSFLSIYLTVFAGRKLGAKMMQKGFIGDRALAGLSGLVGVTMGAASLIPGLDFATRCALFAAAGLGFSNWVNVLQSIELSRPENIGKEASVSSMYILARTSGMATMLMGAFGDYLGTMMGLSPSTAALYALSMPLAAGTASMIINRSYITKDLWPTAKRWGISIKNWFGRKLGFGNSSNAGAADGAEVPAQ